MTRSAAKDLKIRAKIRVEIGPGTAPNHGSIPGRVSNFILYLPMVSNVISRLLSDISSQIEVVTEYETVL